MWWYKCLIPELWKQREMISVEFKASLVNIAGSRPSRAVFQKGKRDQLSAVISHSRVNGDRNYIIDQKE